MEENSLIFMGGLFLFACIGIYIAYRYKKQAEENKRREEAIQRRLAEIKASNERMIQRTKAARSFGNTSSVKTTPSTQYKPTSDTRTMSSIEDDTDIATMMLMNNMMGSPSVSAVSASSYSYNSSSDNDTSTKSSYTSSYSSSSSDSSYSSSSSDSSYSSSSDSGSSWD